MGSECSVSNFLAQVTGNITVIISICLPSTSVFFFLLFLCCCCCFVCFWHTVLHEKQMTNKIRTRFHLIALLVILLLGHLTKSNVFPRERITMCSNAPKEMAAARKPTDFSLTCWNILFWRFRCWLDQKDVLEGKAAEQSLNSPPFFLFWSEPNNSKGD